MMACIGGPPGGGKSTFLSTLGAKFLVAGRNVYPNYGLVACAEMMEYAERLAARKRSDLQKRPLGKIVPIKSLHEMADAEDGEVLLDELPEYLNKQDWDTVPPHVRSSLRQHRKKGKNLWGTAQSYKDIGIDYRRLIQRYITVRRMFSRLIIPMEYHYNLNTNSGTITTTFPKKIWFEWLSVAPLEANVKIGLREVWEIGKFAHAMFDTTEIITPPPDAPRGIKKV